MSALYLYDQHDQEQTKAELDYADWQDAEQYAQSIGRRYNWNVKQIDDFTAVIFRVSKTQRGYRSIDDMPY